MKKLLILSVLTALFALSALAQNNDKIGPPTIEVSGSAEIFVQPDEVSISLDVEKTNKDLQVAKREADQALAQILALTMRFNISPENVKTHYISVEMKYNSIRDPKNRIYDEDGDEIGTKVFLGYEVSTTVSVRMTDIAKFQDFLDEVLKTGLSEVESVNFASSQLRKYKDQAREMAMKAAHEKAAAMAAAIGQSVGKAIFVKEGNLSDKMLNFSGLANNSNVTILDGISRTTVVSDKLATFSPGAISINAQVSVIFLLN